MQRFWCAIIVSVLLLSSLYAQEFSKEEKAAISRLKSIFSFSKRHMETGRSLQKSVASGERLSSRRLHETLSQLAKHIQQAEPHIKVLSQYADKHAESLAAYQEMTTLYGSLNKVYEEIKQKESDSAAGDALKPFTEYVAKIEAWCAGYEKALAGDTPENKANQIINDLKFNLNKAETSLQEAKRRQGNHPSMAEADKKLAAIREKANETLPVIARYAIVQQATVFLTKAKAIGQKDNSKPNSLSPSDPLRRTADAYLKALDYLKKNLKVAGIAQLMKQAEQELYECRQAQMRDLGDGALRAIEQGYFNWIATKLNDFRELAGNDTGLQEIAKEYKPKIVDAACQKAAVLYQKSLREDLESWFNSYWQPILKAADQPELMKTVEAAARSLIEQQLKLAMTALETKGAAEQQMQEFKKHQQNARYLIGTSEELAKLEKGYEAQFTQLSKQLEAQIAKQQQEQAEQERLGRQRFEQGLFPEQNAIYIEWEKQYPAKISQEGDTVCWLYIKPDATNDQADSCCFYFFDAKGKLLRKATKMVGGGPVQGYRDSSTWTQIAEVKKNGEVYGYRDSSTWTQVAEIKENGEIYGYRDSSTWTQIGELKEDGQVYGYRDSSTWTQIAEVKKNGEVYGYRDSSTWTQVAEIKENGEIYGYRDSSTWTQIAEMKIPTMRYRIAVLLFVIYR